MLNKLERRIDEQSENIKENIRMSQNLKSTISELKNTIKKVKSLSYVRFFATSWTVAYQAPLSMGFSRQEYWSGLPFSFSRGSSRPRGWTQVSHIPGRHFNLWFNNRNEKQNQNIRKQTLNVKKYFFLIVVHSPCFSPSFNSYTSLKSCSSPVTSSQICISTMVRLLGRLYALQASLLAQW